jgi:DNA-binding NarL/FixJ family response regulator
MAVDHIADTSNDDRHEEHVTRAVQRRVLLVDDNDAILHREAETLGPTCEVVGMVGDGPAALRAVDALHPDVVVLDISMHGMNGLEVAERLHASGSKAAVVFVTVHDDADFVDAALATGAVGYVIKARLMSDLVLAVEEACAGRRFVSPRERESGGHPR